MKGDNNMWFWIIYLIIALIMFLLILIPTLQNKKFFLGKHFRGDFMDYVGLIAFLLIVSIMWIIIVPLIFIDILLDRKGNSK